MHEGQAQGSDERSARRYTIRWADRDGHRIHVRDYAGPGPAIVLMHGFPDNLHLYDRLIPYLHPGRRVIAFDFLGWGASDKPAGYPYTATNQTGDLDAVIEHSGLDQVILVPHDASGPPAIDWAFGDADPYLNTGVARRLHRLLPTSELHLIRGAGHYVQVDDPQAVAEVILNTHAHQPPR
jgi:pimeloyl-ACP methyl ester carboxylesterase